MDDLKKTGAAIIVIAALGAAAIFGGQPDQQKPEWPAKKVSKDVSRLHLSQRQAVLVQSVLDGQPPEATSAQSAEELARDYFAVAVQMGLRPEDVVSGKTVNLFDFIRK